MTTGNATNTLLQAVNDESKFVLDGEKTPEKQTKQQSSSFSSQIEFWRQPRVRRESYVEECGTFATRGFGNDFSSTCWEMKDCM